MSSTSPPLLERKPESPPLSLEEDLRRVGREIARVLPLLTAVGLATLYLVGAMVKVSQLRAADVSVSDALPLVPLQQLLVGALPVVVYSAILLPISVVAVNGYWRLSDRAEKRWTKFRQRLERIETRSRSIEARLENVEAQGSTASVRDLRRDVDALSDEIGGFGRLKPALALLWRVKILRYSLAAIVCGGLLAFWLLTNPIILTTAFIGATVAGALRRRPAVAGIAVYAVFLVGVLLNAYTTPDPLPVASIRTVDHGLQQGRLIAATDGQWHLAVGQRQIRSIPVSRIVRTRVVSPPSSGAKPVWKLIRDLVRGI